MLHFDALDDFDHLVVGFLFELVGDFVELAGVDEELLVELLERLLGGFVLVDVLVELGEDHVHVETSAFGLIDEHGVRVNEIEEGVRCLWRREYTSVVLVDGDGLGRGFKVGLDFHFDVAGLLDNYDGLFVIILHSV